MVVDVNARNDDRATTMEVDVNEVGAMDVSAERSAAEFGTNGIARSVDRANSYAKDISPLRRGQQSHAQRIGVLCAEDCSPLRKGLCLSAQRLSMISVCRRAVVAAGDYVRLRSLRFAPTHIHRPYSAQRPYPLPSRDDKLIVAPSFLSENRRNLKSREKRNLARPSYNAIRCGGRGISLSDTTSPELPSTSL
jgi:hypothetical protein